jgi:hypothetical protein
MSSTEATEARPKWLKLAPNEQVEKLKTSIAEGQRELAKVMKVAEAPTIHTRQTRRDEKRPKIHQVHRPK